MGCAWNETLRCYLQDFVIQYTSEDPPTEETDWKELRYTDPDETDDVTVGVHLRSNYWCVGNATFGHLQVVPIDGENFNPDTKYYVRIIPRGEIDGAASAPAVFTTGDGGTPVLLARVPRYKFFFSYHAFAARSQRRCS